jgi:hypothetical protein
MSRSRSFASTPSKIALAVLVVAALAGCTTAASQAGGSTMEPSPVPPSAESTSSAEEPTPSTEATPSEEPGAAPAVPDPADVTGWEVSAAGIGPIERAAAFPGDTEQLTTFTTSEVCPGVVTFSKDAAAGLLVTLTAGGSQISTVWVTGRPGEDGTVPASPVTAAGIRLGSTGDELAAAYPDLVSVVQIGADAFGYAVGDDSAGWIDFVVEGDIVTTMGASEVPRAPKEFCG